MFFLKNQFHQTIKELEKNIKNIANTTQNVVTTHILDYYHYRVGYIKSLSIQQPIKTEDAVQFIKSK